MHYSDPELKQRFFAATEESPGSWLLTAMSLRAAAARLDWMSAPVRDDEASTGFIGEYRMLIGLAFENVLKGIISLVRIEAGERPPLPSDCFHHSLATLAVRSECQMLGISPEEIEVLDALTPFVEWGGKYPLPKKIKDYSILSHSSREHDAEISLWNRLAEILAERSWVMKGGPENMGGERLYIRGNRGEA